MSADRPPAGQEPEPATAPLPVRPIGSFAELRSLLIEARSVAESSDSGARAVRAIGAGSPDGDAEALLERAERLAESPLPPRRGARFWRWLAGARDDSSDSRFRLLVALARALLTQQQLERSRASHDLQALRDRLSEIEGVAHELRQASLSLGEAMDVVRHRTLETEPRLRTVAEAHEALAKRTAELETILARRSGSVDEVPPTIDAATPGT